SVTAARRGLVWRETCRGGARSNATTVSSRAVSSGLPRRWPPSRRRRRRIITTTTTTSRSLNLPPATPAPQVGTTKRLPKAASLKGRTRRRRRRTTKKRKRKTTTTTTKILCRRAAAGAAAESAREGTTLTPPRRPGTGTTTTTGPATIPTHERTGAGAPGRWTRSATSASRCARSCRGR
ncbi:unnamed protein product, partial [Ectocarpus sp. 12 AP-2014]